MSQDDLSQKTNLFGYTFEELLQYCESMGEKPFRAKQLFKWIYQKGILNWDDMSDLSKDVRARLAQTACLTLPPIVHHSVAKDGTEKWLMQVDEKNLVETVFIPEARRGTLCISSQVGCKLNCQFCSTGKQGFNRDLSTAEIIAQLFHARQRGLKVTNVVMMGMGEPLLNFTAVSPALKIMRHPDGFDLPKRRVTVSTAGLVPYIDKLSQENDVALAISLHAPTNDLRDELVPLNKKYPIEMLIEACRQYSRRAKKTKITIEYIMLKEVNDQPQHAIALAACLRNLPCKVNLIPFNPFPLSGLERSSDEAIHRFRHILQQKGYVVTVRKTRGEDIDAACGQLVGNVMDKTRRQARWRAQGERKCQEKIAIKLATA